jgi:hypothetical protein
LYIKLLKDNNYFYRDIFKAVDEFMAPRFTATSASLAAKCMPIFAMTQNA